MMKSIRQLFIFVIIIVVLVIVLILGMELNKHINDEQTDTATGITDTQSSEEASKSEEYLDKYGEPDDFFLEVNIDGAAEASVDFDFLNGLKVYKAVPVYEEDELMQKVASLFCDESDGYDVSTKDYASIDVLFTGWGELYSYTDEDGYTFMSGSAFSVIYEAGSLKKYVAKEEQLAFFENLIEAYDLGIQDGSYDVVSCDVVQNTYGYTLQTYIDGIRLIDKMDGAEFERDQDGVWYSGATFDLDICFDDNDYVSEIGPMHAAEIMVAYDLSVSYEDMEAIADILYKNLTIATGTVYSFDTVTIIYNIGITEETEYIISPWMMLEGEAAYYFPDTGWDVSDKKIYLNLNTGDVYNE